MNSEPEEMQNIGETHIPTEKTHEHIESSEARENKKVQAR